MITDLEGSIVFERTRYCKNGDAHIKLLKLLLQIETSLLELANRNLPMEKLSKSMRKKILKKQGNNIFLFILEVQNIEHFKVYILYELFSSGNRCNHCLNIFEPGEQIVADH